MKKRFMGMEFEISEWTPKLRYAVIFFALLSLIFLILSLFFKIDIPGAFCLSAGVVALLLGIRFMNIYLKKKQDKPELRRCFCNNFCSAYKYFDYTDGIVFPQRDLTELFGVRYIRIYKKNNFNIWE